MEFAEAALLLYLYGVQLKDSEINTGKLIQDNNLDNRRMTLIAVETQSLNVIWLIHIFRRISNSQNLSYFKKVNP